VTNRISPHSRKPRHIIVEAIPHPDEIDRENNRLLGQALARVIVALINQKLATGDLVNENGIVRVNQEKQIYEQKF
jgi:hypothetical protein